jgi:preprotein translocase subunit SecG
MLYYLLVTLYVLACFLLLLVVLLQQGKGGDMASAFGGGGSSQTAFGARAGATVLTRATTILGALFMIGAIVIGIYGQRGPGSVLSGVRGPVQPTSTQPATPPPQQPKK